MGKRPRPARPSNNTAHWLAQRVEVDQKNYASWGRKAYSCARSLLLQAQKWRVLACRVLYRNGAPFRTRRRTHTQLKLLVIFSTLNGSSAVGADFGLTRCRREFQHASRQRALSLWDRSIVVRSCRSFETEDFAYAVKAMALEEMHSRIKLMIAGVVGRRGKWRTLWRVTTKPGQH